MYTVKGQIEDEESPVSEDDKEDIRDAITEIIDWMESTPDAGMCAFC